MSNYVDWGLIPEDVEAIVLFDREVPSYYKTINGALYVQCYRGFSYKKSASNNYERLQYHYEDRLRYRPSGPFSPSQIKFLHETTDMLHKMINAVEPKPPSINDILQEAQQAILQYHNISGKVAFTVTTE